jgi:hypothetical protein
LLGCAAFAAREYVLEKNSGSTDLFLVDHVSGAVSQLTHGKQHDSWRLCNVLGLFLFVCLIACLLDCLIVLFACLSLREDEHGAAVERRRRPPVLHVHAQWKHASALHAARWRRVQAADLFSREWRFLLALLSALQLRNFGGFVQIEQGGVHGYKLFQRQGTPMLAVVLEVYADKTPEETAVIDEQVCKCANISLHLTPHLTVLCVFACLCTESSASQVWLHWRGL